MSYSIGNAVQMNRDYPDSFFLPEAADISNLKRGDNVKLIFHSTSTNVAERMWVQITRINSNNRITGVINSQPFMPELQPGSRITFSTDNIIDIYTG